jgi:hypothetical protein
MTAARIVAPRSRPGAGIVFLVLAAIAPLAEAQAPGHQKSGRGLDGGGRSQIFRLIEYRPIERDFVLYDDGLVFFEKRRSAGNPLGWFQARLTPQQMAAVVNTLRNKEFSSLSGSYELPDSANGDYWMCGLDKDGGRVEATIDGVAPNGGDAFATRGARPPMKKGPNVLARLFSMVRSLQEGESTPFEPEWIVLSMGGAHARWNDITREPGPARELTPDWLRDASRPDKNTIRVSGRHQAAVAEFLTEREHNGPVLVDGLEVSLTMQPVLPGRRTCEPTTVEGGTSPAERSPGERPPRETATH